MEKTTREKIALVVFILGLFLALVISVLYMIVGHSWNIAASHIDVSINALDRFNVVVYEGMSQRYFADNATETEDSEASLALSLRDAFNAQAAVSSVKGRYIAAGATVLALDAVNAEHYQDGLIIPRNNTRFGVLSVTEGESQELIAQRLAYLTESKVDLLVVISPYAQLLEDFDGIDVIVCTQDPLSSYVEGVNQGGTFVVSPPKYAGSVGAVLVSDNKVALAKTFE